MPRQLTVQWNFDELEDEILFTRAAIKADEDAADLLPMTDKWLGKIVPIRAADLETREHIAEVDGGRVVANGRFDIACVAFADALFAAVGKDRGSLRWLAFFVRSVTRFIRMALVDQVARVRGWLSSSKDPVLELHRAELDKRVTAADLAVVSTRGLAVGRGENWQRRAELAEDLTRERDGLHDALSGVARDKKLPRHWADLFFARERRTRPEPAGGGGGTTPT